jgi:sec-independent protein translocase protein TatA
VVESTDCVIAGEGAIMGLGIPELIVILFLVILIFGASRLPEIGKGIGKGIRNFKEATKDGRDDR